jgi:RHS repeat-associated protein
LNNPGTFNENDKFGMKLEYNTITSPAVAKYNGNIASFTWGTPNLTNARYVYTYDNNNRLTNANYTATYNTSALDENFTYDANGNITTLDRYNYTGSYIDRLVFTYQGNRVTGLKDNAGDNAYVIDYPGTYNLLPYIYDYNGNVTNEPHKQLGLGYNLLNLPNVINWNGLNRKINYFYTFNGEKLRKTVENNGTITKVDYCGPFVYETTSGTRSLKYIATPFGRAVKNGSAWVYEYNLTDHLGNVRVVIKKGTNGLATIVQQKGYYAFGMEISQFSSGTGTSKNWYNGKEIQDDFGLYWYDYGARFYDPALGRFHTVDPLAEDYYNLSPYGYCAGNPIAYRDENGEWINLVVGAIVGAATDYALQVATNYVEGKTGMQAWTDVKGGSIAVSAAAGATGVGIASKVSKVIKVAELARTTQIAVKVGSEVVTDAAASAANQLVTDGKVDIKDVAIDVAAGQLVGNTVSKAVHNKAQASETAKVLHNQADRAQRVANGSREVRQVAADKAATKAESYGTGRATAAGVASSNTASTVVKELDEKDKH